LENFVIHYQQSCCSETIIIHGKMESFPEVMNFFLERSLGAGINSTARIF